MKAFFSPKYTVEMGDHVFSTVKFGLTAEKLKKDGALAASDLVEPEPATRAELLLAHTTAWVDKALKGAFTQADVDLMELPYSPELVTAHRLAAGGTILACREALECGLGLHVGGGSHHAMPDHGEGFCMFNDIAIGLLKLLGEREIRRAAVIDLDVHQGNGTAAIFSKKPAVFTFSMHQENNFPPIKPPSSLDVNLADGTGDEEYLATLLQSLPRVLDSKPELVVYQAGADVYAQDMLGGLRLTKPGIRLRDQAVFKACFDNDIPVAVTLGGGYAARLEDTVLIHAGTCEEALDCHLKFWRAGDQ